MIVYIYNIGVDLYNGFNGLRHRINWTYFTVLDGLAHPLYSNCDILPICNGGGCTIYRKNHKYKPTCKFYKDTLIKQVIDTFDNLQDNIDR